MIIIIEISLRWRFGLCENKIDVNHHALYNK